MFFLVAISYKPFCVKANNPNFHGLPGVLSIKGTTAWMLYPRQLASWQLSQRRKRLNAHQMFTVNQNQQHAVCLPPPRHDFGNQRNSTKGFLLLSPHWHLDKFGISSQIITER